MTYPLVSAIVLCYNHERFVLECLESVRLQGYPNLELIVSDDASKDRSASLIEGWLRGSGIPHRFHRNEVNVGVCKSLNKALEHARGKYVAQIASDDVWLPDKLLTQVARMEELPRRVGVLYSDALQIDEYGNLLPGKFISSHRRFEQMPEGNIHRTLWENNFIPAMTTLIRRECFGAVGLYDESLAYEDWDMWLRLSREFDFAYAERVSAKYRLVATSMSHVLGPRIIDAACQICLKHLNGKEMAPEVRRAAVLQLQRWAMLSFEQSTPRCRRNLVQALRHGMSPKIAARIAFACCGLGAAQYERVRSLTCGPREGFIASADT